jgi:hypothetical protein
LCRKAKAPRPEAGAPFCLFEFRLALKLAAEAENQNPKIELAQSEFAKRETATLR